MDDTKAEMARLRTWLFIAVAFIASMIYSCNEGRYWVFGRTADARIVSVTEYSEMRGGKTGVLRGPREGLEVKYSFTEAGEGGKTRTEADRIGKDWQRPPNDVVPVRYLAGSPEMSRFAERHNWIPLLVFGAMCVVVIVKTILFLREYKQDQASLARSRAMSDVRYK